MTLGVPIQPTVLCGYTTAGLFPGSWTLFLLLGGVGNSQLLSVESTCLQRAGVRTAPLPPSKTFLSSPGLCSRGPCFSFPGVFREKPPTRGMWCDGSSPKAWRDRRGLISVTDRTCRGSQMPLCSKPFPPPSPSRAFHLNFSLCGQRPHCQLPPGCDLGLPCPSQVPPMGSARHWGTGTAGIQGGPTT